MRIATLFSLLLALAASSAGADDSLRHARRARALLGPGVWSQIIRIENLSGTSLYPRQLHALVFELVGVLWFYTEADGTQSFSLHLNRLAEEKADFAPLLRDVDPGFVAWAVVEDGLRGEEDEALSGRLPNGCFIQSYAALRRLQHHGAPIAEPQLLSYYVRSRGRRPGHTVLTYSTADSVVVFDPEQAETLFRFPAELGADPRKLARALAGQEVDRARVVPLQLPTRERERMALTGDETVTAGTDRRVS